MCSTRVQRCGMLCACTTAQQQGTGRGQRTGQDGHQAVAQEHSGASNQTAQLQDSAAKEKSAPDRMAIRPLPRNTA